MIVYILKAVVFPSPLIFLPQLTPSPPIDYTLCVNDAYPCISDAAGHPVELRVQPDPERAHSHTTHTNIWEESRLRPSLSPARIWKVCGQHLEYDGQRPVLHYWRSKYSHASLGPRRGPNWWPNISTIYLQKCLCLVLVAGQTAGPIGLNLFVVPWRFPEMVACYCFCFCFCFFNFEKKGLKKLVLLITATIVFNAFMYHLARET